MLQPTVGLQCPEHWVGRAVVGFHTQNDFVASGSLAYCSKHWMQLLNKMPTDPMIHFPTCSHCKCYYVISKNTPVMHTLSITVCSHKLVQVSVFDVSYKQHIIKICSSPCGELSFACAVSTPRFRMQWNGTCCTGEGPTHSGLFLKGLFSFWRKGDWPQQRMQFLVKMACWMDVSPL